MNPDPASLDRLHDLISPPAVSWWPPAPGWLWLGAFVLLLGLVFVLRFFKHWQRNRYRREALAELAGAGSNPGQMAELLKRTALSVYAREKVASLTGPSWLAFLDRSAGMKAFVQGPGNRLEGLAYDPRLWDKLDKEDLLELKNLAAEWIRKHNPEFERKKC